MKRMSFLNRIKKSLTTEPIEVRSLDMLIPKYTEKDLFDATEEAFRHGYASNSECGINPDEIGSNRILNIHKKWFNSFRNITSFKRK